MMKNKKGQTDWMNIIGSILLTTIMLGIISLMVLNSADDISNTQMCHEQGYDGITPSYSEKECSKCYKKIPSQTGIGYEKEYSGCIE